jgi:hypothetical protein
MTFHEYYRKNDYILSLANWNWAPLDQLVHALTNDKFVSLITSVFDVEIGESLESVWILLHIDTVDCLKKTSLHLVVVRTYLYVFYTGCFTTGLPHIAGVI